MAQVMDIVGRTWTKIAEFDIERSFERGNSEEASPRLVVDEKGWTLFSFDVERQMAVFVDVGPDCNVSHAPFAYVSQFENAKRILLMGFDDVVDLAQALPRAPNLIQLFNIGHCGSTLLHHVFNHVPGVWCVSEPIAFINLALNREKLGDELVKSLAVAALKLVMRFPGADEATWVVVKHFSQSTAQMGLLHSAEPDGKAVFMYRDALSWSNSHYHFAQKHGATLDLSIDKRSFYWWIMSGGKSEDFLERVVDMKAERVGFDALSAMSWALHIQQFEDAKRSGVPLYALRYNELMEQREQTLNELFSHLGIPHGHVAATLKAFEIDAHQGTRTARRSDDLHFGPENYAVVEAILAHPRVSLDPHIRLDLV
jgi:D-alanyl-D-alanine dipeptidase